MNRARRRRIPSLAAVIAVVWCLGLAWAPAAHAGPLDGLPGDPEGSDASEAVSGVADAVGGAVDDATDAVSDAVSDAVGQAGGSISGGVGAAGDAVDETGEVVDSAVGGVTGSDPGVGETVDGATDGVTDAVDGVAGDAGDAVDEVGGTVDEVTGTTGEVVDGATGGAGGSTDPVIDPIEEVVDGVGGTVDGAADAASGGAGALGRGARGGLPSASLDGSVQPGVTTPASGSETLAGSAADVRQQSAARSRRAAPPSGTETGDGAFERIPAASIDAFARSLSVAAGALAETATDTSAPASRSPWDGVFEAASEIAKRVAFPIALALIVAGFLAVHNRIDRRDPKLALAPIDQDQEVLHFQ